MSNISIFNKVLIVKIPTQTLQTVYLNFLKTITQVGSGSSYPGWITGFASSSSLSILTSARDSIIINYKQHDGFYKLHNIQLNTNIEFLFKQIDDDVVIEIKFPFTTTKSLFATTDVVIHLLTQGLIIKEKKDVLADKELLSLYIHRRNIILNEIVFGISFLVLPLILLLLIGFMTNIIKN